MTIKHVIRRENTEPKPHRFTERTQGRSPVAIPRPDAIHLKTALPEAVKMSSNARRVQGFFRGRGGAMLQMLFDLYGGEPVDIKFGDKIIHFEVRDGDR